MQKTIVLINPASHQGKAWKRWLSIRRDVQQRLSQDCKEVVLEKGVTLEEAIDKPFQQDEPLTLISAGGDGSIHYLVNYLLKTGKEKVRNVTVGAIGLGSSNDFLKPFAEKIKGIPVRIKAGTEAMHDVGIATFSDDTKEEQQKFFIVNASVGITAQANWNFNHPGAFLGLLKKTSTGAAIIYTAVSSILRHRNVPLSLAFNELKLDTSISNINILKLPFVSGSFYYKQAVSRNDGRFGLNVCMNMTRPELLSVLHGLQSGNFRHNHKTLTAFTTGIDIHAEQDFIFECDGETGKTRSLNVRISPNAINVLKD